MKEEAEGGRERGEMRDSSPGEIPADTTKDWSEDSGSWNPDQWAARNDLQFQNHININSKLKIDQIPRVTMKT